MPTLDTRIASQQQKLEQLIRQKKLKERAAKDRARKASKALETQARKADAHRKIGLGGLVIVAGVDDWNEAEIVGALLMASQRLQGENAETFRTRFREAGFAHMEARKAKR